MTDHSHYSAPSADETIDVGTLANSIARDDFGPVRAYFQAQEVTEPRVIWSPEARFFGSPVIRSFAEVCDVLGEPGGGIPEAGFGLDAFDGLDRWLMVLERQGEHFRYLHYGSEIRDHYGSDMTGRTTADFGGYISLFFEALYHATIVRGERVLSEHEPPRRVFVRAWRRLIVPLIGSDEQVMGFVAANVPDNELRAGLEMIVDPVIVTDRDGEVQYVNAAAQQFFRIAPGPLRSLKAMTGLELDGLKPPEVLLARREVIERLELFEHKSGLMDRVALSISAAEHRGRAYYVTQVRPIDRG